MMTVKRQKPKSSQSSTLSHSNRGKATGRAQNVRAPEGLGWELRSAHLPAAAERVRTQSPWPCPKRTVPLPGPGDQFQESVRTGEHQSASADMARSSLQRTVLVRGPGPQRLSLPEPARRTPYLLSSRGGDPRVRPHPSECFPGVAVPSVGSRRPGPQALGASAACYWEPYTWKRPSRAGGLPGDPLSPGANAETPFPIGLSL